ncbi:FAD-dependent monooxygenase [Aquella oligotrophica]|uniref:Ubiquinone biosynthesis protein UbiH n=1 Tax=Aquella oligotrophica TaxID=2067065 RepID=A0A2I7N4Q5_9NEIS|nr:FAD-dependent monooxygenase [Aquella oligotrophica]AUR51195.1 ubiquinone biosynthesis protein UbiH [Aquella oligotrophica]
MAVNKEFDIIIIGGGLVGSAFAADVLSHSPNTKILIIEAKKPEFIENPPLDSKIYAVSPKNFEQFTKIGVFPDLSRVGKIEKMNVFGNANGAIDFDSGNAYDGYLARLVEYGNLQKAILDKLEEYPNLEMCYGQIATIDNQISEVRVVMADKSVYTGSLLVAADGGNSFVRKVVGFNSQQIDYEQSGVVANFNCEKDHANTAYQWFLGDSILAFLPLPDKKISIVWSTSNPELLLDLSYDGFVRAVEEASQNKLGKLELITKPQAFPLKLNLIEKCYKDRVILIGDAFHTIHPLAGQGLILVLVMHGNYRH